MNPRSGRGLAGRRWRQLESRVRDGLGTLDVERTRGPRDAVRLAREAVRAGVERLVVAGGDGTLAEVATGLIGAELGDYVEVGTLPLGSGCDFARTLGIPRDPLAALEVLRQGKAQRVDAVRARYTGRDGTPQVSCLLNVASFGVSGLTVELARRVPGFLGARFAFAAGAVAALLRQRGQAVSLRVDGAPFADGDVVLVAAANGRHFGGGMRIAPQARPDDGWLDVVCVDAAPVGSLLARLPKLYRGTHLGDPLVRYCRGRRIEAASPAKEVRLELDGEPLGVLPVDLEILPGALAVIGPPA